LLLAVLFTVSAQVPVDGPGVGGSVSQ
jgi:hypothetical protein